MVAAGEIQLLSELLPFKKHLCYDSRHLDVKYVFCVIFTYSVVRHLSGLSYSQISTCSFSLCAGKLILIPRQKNRINILVIVYFQLKDHCALNNNRKETRLSNVWGWVPWINIYEQKSYSDFVRVLYTQQHLLQ